MKGRIFVQSLKAGIQAVGLALTLVMIAGFFTFLTLV